MTTPRTNAQWSRLAIGLVETARTKPSPEDFLKASADLVDELGDFTDPRSMGIVLSVVVLELASVGASLADNWQAAEPDTDVAAWLQQLSWQVALDDDGRTPLTGVRNG